jgi:hypothetical protein
MFSAHIFRIPLATVAATFAFLANAQTAMPARQAALIDTYCTKCHNEEDWAGSLDLNLLDRSNVVSDAETWEKVMRKFRGSMMPPKGNERPTASEQLEFVSWLQGSLDSAILAHPNPGKSSLHRLNRTEYGNAIRDLLGLQVDISELLPADDEGYGFDNIADVLRTSPSLLEQYLLASRKISELAIGDPNIAPISKVYKVAPDLPQAQHIPGLPLGTRGGILIEHNFPLDAEYELNSVLVRNIVGYMTGLEWPHQFEISIDGERVFLAQVGGEADNLSSDQNMSAAADMIDARLKTRVPVSAGLHKVAVTFLQKNAAETHEPLELHTRDLDLQNMNGVPTLDYVDIIGPFKATGSGDTASRAKIFSCYPQAVSEEQACATAILGTIGKRAYRHPLGQADLNMIMSFYEDGRETGGFEHGIQTALRFILTSPEFLFRSEPDPDSVAPGEVYALSDLALASRLSFFLWSSIPDDELLNLAASNKLHEPEVFEQQVERLLRDPKSTALVDNFAAQWLFLRNLKSINPDTRTFPDFDDKLRQAFRTETTLFVTSILQNDSSILDMINADYTYVNDRLAQHYGIPNIYGSHFRRVQQVDPNRRGLLGQGSVLTVTSYPNRTSPVLRGKWVLENLIGAPPPSPPPNVPALNENTPGLAAMSVRDRMIQHRADPACSGCHAVMDPLGFSLENFDAIGRYRSKDASGVIDSSGQLADGTPIENAISLEQTLMEHPEYFVDTFTEKLLTYALGRGLEYYDMPVVRAITQQAEADNYKFSAIIKGIVSSVPFRMKQADAPNSEVAKAAVSLSE